MDTLRFALVDIPGASAASQARVYTDFIISDRSLSQLLEFGKAHQTGVFYAGQPKAAIERRIKLFTAEPRRTPGRVHFFVCAECGNLACGAVTACIEVYDNRVVWQDFAWDFGDEEPESDNAEPIGPFVFDRTEYFRAFAALPGLLGEPLIR